MSERQFDRAKEDVGNILNMEHIKRYEKAIQALQF